MDCSCSIDYTEHDNDPELYDEKIVKSRKDHKCSECRRVIKKGEHYKRIKGLWDGYFSTYKHCADCQSIAKEFFHSFNFECLLDDLWEFIRDSDGEVSQTCISKLTPGARNKVCSIIEEVWKDNEESGYYDD
jgi:hypothetical protein